MVAVASPTPKTAYFGASWTAPYREATICNGVSVACMAGPPDAPTKRAKENSHIAHPSNVQK
jgi:hypothetical protein